MKLRLGTAVRGKPQHVERSIFKKPAKMARVYKRARKRAVRY